MKADESITPGKTLKRQLAAARHARCIRHNSHQWLCDNYDNDNDDDEEDENENAIGDDGFPLILRRARVLLAQSTASVARLAL